MAVAVRIVAVELDFCGPLQGYAKEEFCIDLSCIECDFELTAICKAVNSKSHSANVLSKQFEFPIC